MNSIFHFIYQKRSVKQFFLYNNSVDDDKKQLQNKHINHVIEKELAHSEKLGYRKIIAKFHCYGLQSTNHHSNTDISTFYYISKLMSSILNFSLKLDVNRK